LVVVVLPPDEDFLSGFLEDFLSPPESATFFLLPDLKSVSYQPDPLRRNEGADTIFCIADLPHSGHTFSGSSLIFCSTSV
jgi:hypothetical protein